ncbi:MAG TPA: PhzF family phenazine biosynthesis protein [Acidimicrobiales bacterium]|jgi:PhzF family phenazine biosynthesis protein
MSTSITWVDAFSDRPYGGNPAAVCLPETPLADDVMQSLAFELGIAETAFVMPADMPGEWHLRWFSPTTEIDLCGHATLASAHAMRERGVVDGNSPVTFHTRSGPLVASFDGDLVALDFPATRLTPMELPAPLRGEFAADHIVDVGRTDFFCTVTLTTEAAVRDYQPDLSAITELVEKALLVTAQADNGSKADYVLRVFGPKVGIDEDPATGSAQCAVGPYWADALERPELVAHQLSPRGAILHVRPDGDRVHIAGHAVTVLSGHLC